MRTNILQGDASFHKHQFSGFRAHYVDRTRCQLIRHGAFSREGKTLSDRHRTSLLQLVSFEKLTTGTFWAFSDSMDANGSWAGWPHAQPTAQQQRRQTQQ
jgi:hypothetical protein